MSFTRLKCEHWGIMGLKKKNFFITLFFRFYIKENKQYVGKLEENKTIDGIKVKTNKLNYEVLNISVYQNI